MIKVLHILTRLIRGGADEAVVFIVTGLEAATFDVTLLVGGDSDPQYVQQVLPTTKLAIEPSLRRDVNPLSDLRAIFRLYRFIKQGGYDIVHTHTAKAGFLGRLAARLAGVPVIVHTLHGITFHDFRPSLEQAIYIFLEKVAATCTTRIIAVGADLQHHYLRHGIGRASQYTMIHTGMELERFFNAGKFSAEQQQQKRHSFQLTSTDRVIGVVSRLDTGKGQEYLLQAAPSIIERFPNVKIMIVGDGPHRKRLETLARQLDIASHVIFTGFRRDIEEVIAIFDIAAFTSLWEGLPRVIVQYAAVGKPIVAFEIPGVSELVTNGINGFTVPLRDTERFAQRMIALLENPEEANLMGQAGRQLIDESWRVEAMVQRIAQEYQSLLKETVL